MARANPGGASRNRHRGVAPKADVGEKKETGSPSFERLPVVLPSSRDAGQFSGQPCSLYPAKMSFWVLYWFLVPGKTLLNPAITCAAVRS